VTADVSTGEDHEARAQLAAARASLAELETRLTPAHPDVARQRGLVRELETAASREAPVRTGGTPNDAAIRRLTEGIAAREAQLARLQRSIAAMRASIARGPGQSAELEALQADHDALKTLQENLTRKARVLVAAGLGGAEPMRLVSPATRPSSPARPNRRRILFLSSASALLLAIAVAGVLETRDLAIYDEDDLRSLTDAPLLGAISEVLTDSEAAAVRTRTNLRNALVPAAALILVAAWWWA
jgi:uncharacterized protein involved in exopolysaccharide biosynthesis